MANPVGTMQAQAMQETVVKTIELKMRLDSFMNGLTGIGTTSRDKRLAGRPMVNILGRQDCEDLYRGNDIAALIIENVPDEKWRKGFDVCIEDAEGGDQAEAVMSYLRDLGFFDVMREAEIRARQFGGGAVMIGARDGSFNMGKPLRTDRIQSIDYLTVFDRHELVAASFYGDPFAPKYGLPESYYIQPLYSNGADVSRLGSMRVHESRLILFDGSPVTRQTRHLNQGWGDPVLVKIYETLRDFNLTWGGTANYMSDFAQAVVKLRGLNEMMVGAQGDEVAAKRAQCWDMMRSIARCIVLDAGDATNPSEEYKREVGSLAGLPDILVQFTNRVASAAKMPVSLLAGQAPAGLNATGDSDIRWYYDRIASAQENELKPRIMAFLRAAFACKNGPTNGQEPENWSIRFHPLWQLDALQEAQRRKTIADTDVAYVTAGIVTPEEASISRFGGDQYNPEMTIDKAAHEAMAKARDAGDLNQPTLKTEKPTPEEEAAKLAAMNGGKPPAKPADKEDSMLSIVNDEFDPDQARETNGEWAKGGAGTKSLEGKSTKDLAERFHSLTWEAPQGGAANPAHESHAEYKAHARALKKRGVTSLAKLALARAGGFDK